MYNLICFGNLHLFVLEVFDNYMQQDAHEFFNYLLNTVGDLLQGKSCDTHVQPDMTVDTCWK